jgi:dihydrolipoamide dehydrogenase
MRYDILVLGSGPGGYVTAIRAAQLGFKTAIVEKERLGGVCLNWGCIPTKALLKSAQVFDDIKHAAAYGVKTGEPEADLNAMVERSREVAEAMSKGVEFLMRKNNITVIKGFGKVLPGGQVEILHDDGLTSTVSASHIIIATGARARELPNLPIDGEKVIGYRQAMTPDKQPESMIVVGSGAIGVEFAYFYHTIGTKVTIVEYLDRIVPLEDEEVSKQLARSFKKSKIKVMTSASLMSVDTSGDKVKAVVNTKKGDVELEADVVLSAVGIQANIENIGLEETGIAVDKGKIVVNDFYETNIPGYYAIGDVIDTPALAHVASAEGIACVEKIAGLDVEKIDYNNIPGAIYTYPEIASTGFTEKQAIEAGYDILVGKFPFTASGKAKAAGKTDGFVKLIIDKKYDEILGAHLIGAHVTEMISEIVSARKAEATGHTILKAIHPHPTMSEAIMEAAAAAYDEVIHL